MARQRARKGQGMTDQVTDDQGAEQAEQDGQVYFELTDAVTALQRAQGFEARMTALVGDDEKLRKAVENYVNRLRTKLDEARTAREQWTENVRAAALNEPAPFPKARNRTRTTDAEEENGDEG